jgi:hypothetical protein
VKKGVCHGYKITAAYNLTSCKAKTYRVPKDGTPAIAEGFGFEAPESTIERISEPFCLRYGIRPNQNPPFTLTGRGWISLLANRPVH